MPVIPATQEAEAGESLEPGWWKLQLTKILPLLGNRARLHLKKEKNIVCIYIHTKKNTKTGVYIYTYTRIYTYIYLYK